MANIPKIHTTTPIYVVPNNDMKNDIIPKNNIPLKNVALLKNNVVVQKNNDFVSFPYGVWSGDVSTTTIVLSTRVETKSDCSVMVKVSTETLFDPDIAAVFTKQIDVKKDSNDYRTNPGDFIAKVEVSDLKPNTRYFYQFFSKNMLVKSMLGSFMTLPSSSSLDKISFAVIGCKNMPPFDPIHGLALDGKVKFVHFCGNSVYADLSLDPLTIPQSKLLEYYRQLYRNLHSSDYVGNDFIEVFRRMPVINNWDDGEVIKDYAGNGSNSAIQTNFDFNQRNVEELKKVGYQAFIEYAAIPNNDDNKSNGDDSSPFSNLPLRGQGGGINRIFRKIQVNSNVLNIILDERQYRDPPAFVPNNVNFPAVPVLPPSDPAVPNSPPLTIDQLLAVPVLGPALVQLRDTNPSAFSGLFGAKSNIRNQRDLHFLGNEQKEWFKKTLLESKSVFKFVINEVPFGDYIFFPYDSWAGYYQERQEIIDFIQQNRITGVIFLTANANSAAINRVSSVGDNVPIWEIMTGPIGQRTMDADIRSIGGNPDFYYAFVSAFNASASQGGIPQLTNNGLKFLVIDTPNWLRVDYNDNNTVTISLRDKNDLIITDKIGRQSIVSIDFAGGEVSGTHSR